MSTQTQQQNGKQNGAQQQAIAKPAAQQVQRQDPKTQAISTFNQYLEMRKGVLAKMLPRHLTPDRLIKVALLAYSKTPKLRECSLESIWQSVAQAAELGLEPGGVLGHAYLVPFKGECTLIPGYRGLIDLARRSGEIESIEAHVVCERDKFTLRFGLDPVLEHEPFLDGDAGSMRFVYAVAKLKDGGKQLEVMTRAQVEKIRNNSPDFKFKGANSVWGNHFEEMARKTVVRRLIKYLPISVERNEALVKALEADNEQEPLDISPAPTSEDKAQSRSDQLAARLAEVSDGQIEEPAQVQAGEANTAPVEEKKINIIESE